MKVLVTGGFGNVGRGLLDEIIQRGYTPIVFQRPSKKNKKKARKYRNKIEMFWGDVRNTNDVRKAIENSDVVIHLAAKVPPRSEEDKDATFKVNVDGTMNFIKAIEKSKKSIGFIFGSSMSIMGPTQSKEPPINPYDNPNPTTNYTHSKFEIEKYLQTTSINYCICRIGAVITTNGQYSKSMLDEAFNFPLDNRLETILDLDCATALTNAAELMTKDFSLQGKILNLGGGKELGHFIFGRDFTQQMFELMGIGALDERAYSPREYFMDWSDTTESQALLDFQKHTYHESLEMIGKPYKKIRLIMKLFSKFLRAGIQQMSPYYKEAIKKIEE